MVFFLKSAQLMTDLPMANFYAQGYTGEVFGADTTGKQLSNEVTRFDVK